MGEFSYKVSLSVVVKSNRELNDCDIEMIAWQMHESNRILPNGITMDDEIDVDHDFLGEKMTDEDCIPFDERKDK